MVKQVKQKYMNPGEVKYSHTWIAVSLTREVLNVPSISGLSRAEIKDDAD